MMAPTFNPFLNTSFAGGYYMPTSLAATDAATSFSAGANSFGGSGGGVASAGALVLYQPNNCLHGLWYHDDLHSPFATGRQVNPFVPGLSPVGAHATPKPTYVAEDPLRALFPAVRSADDPLNEITDQLFADVRAACKAASSEKQKPLLATSAPRH